MTRPISRFESKNTCPHCQEPLRLVALSSTTVLLQRRFLLMCPSPNCSYSAGVDAKNVRSAHAQASDGRRA